MLTKFLFWLCPAVFMVLLADTYGQVPETLWTKTYGEDRNDLGQLVLQTTDNGYVIGAHVGPHYSGNYDIWIIKTDSLGDTLWTLVYGGPGLEECWAAIETEDHGLRHQFKMGGK